MSNLSSGNWFRNVMVIMFAVLLIIALLIVKLFLGDINSGNANFKNRVESITLHVANGKTEFIDGSEIRSIIVNYDNGDMGYNIITIYDEEYTIMANNVDIIYKE